MGEPITKGLREYIERHPTMMHAVGLADLLDNIDAIHRSLEQENERLRDESERGDDWIKLPVDADGVPIRVGDIVQYCDEKPVKVEVIRYQAFLGGIEAVFYARDGAFSFGSHTFKSIHHVKPDTWESIIEDAVKLGFTDPDNEHLADKLVARCKALCERTREEEE